jgi:hypothetical protein
MWPILPPWSYIAGCFQLEAQSAATCSHWFHTRGFSTLKMEAICSSKCWFTQDLHNDTSQKMAFFITTAVKTSNLTST